VPTLIIAGDRDGFTPARLSERMRDEIPGAELLMIEGGSHTAPLERPHLVGDTVLAFLARALG
jgi:pimeloyl-ACP methyl ester carboxylesterase